MRIDRVKLIAEMARQDITSIKLAEKSGVSRVTVSAVRCGKACSTSTAGKIAATLGVPVESITLTAYEVEYIDQRQPKPRTVHRETVVLDGGKLSALERLGMRPAGYLAQQFERSGYTVATIRRGETINAHVDLAELWTRTRNEIRVKQLEKQAAEIAARLGGGSDADK